MCHHGVPSHRYGRSFPIAPGVADLAAWAFSAFLREEYRSLPHTGHGPRLRFPIRDGLEPLRRAFK